MPRPRKTRFVQGALPASYYKPRGIPMSGLVETVLSLDGFEALRFADVDGLDQTEAAARMGISRPTFSRLLAEARKVVATALTRGWALRIEGGPVATIGPDGFPCRAICHHRPFDGDGGTESEAEQANADDTVQATDSTARATETRSPPSGPIGATPAPPAAASKRAARQPTKESEK